MAPILWYPSRDARRARRVRRWAARTVAVVAVLACAAAATLTVVRLRAPHLLSVAGTPAHVETGPAAAAPSPAREQPAPPTATPVPPPPPAPAAPPPVPSPPPSAAGAMRLLAGPGQPTNGVQSVEAVLGAVPRLAAASGAAVHVGDAPMAPGHWGVYEPHGNVVYVGRAAFSDAARLHYVVAHELAHAYWFQVATGTQRMAFEAAVAGGPPVRGGSGELFADCVASLWGSSTSYYWTCPPAARDAIAAAMISP